MQDDPEEVHVAIGLDPEATAVHLMLTHTPTGRQLVAVLAPATADRLIRALQEARRRLGRGPVAGLSTEPTNYPTGPGRKPYPDPPGNRV